MISKQPHIVVVGAGIVGASLAYQLARRQARVTLLDKAPEPANGVTGKSFAWITAGHEAPKFYSLLKQQAIADWHRLEDELKGQLAIDWPGAITWLANASETESLASKLICSGHSVRLVNEAEIRRLEPNLKAAPAVAIFAESEGAIDPVRTTEGLIEAARESGAVIQLGNEVLAFLTNGSRIGGVVTANGTITADMVVVANGSQAATLCQPLGLTIAITVSPSLLMRFLTHRRFVNHIVSNPLMEVRAASNTLLLAAEDYRDESPESNPQSIAQRTLEKIKKHWQGAEQIQLANVAIGQRPMPQDGLPVIGRTKDMEGLYLLVMHSGVTLAAIAGRLAAAEILSDQDIALLSPYRPGRFD